MTGFGRGEVTQRGISITVELRSVNNRFFEVSMRLPNSLSLREKEIKDLLRKNILRGKVQLSCSVSHEQDSDLPLEINSTAVKSIMKILKKIKSSAKLNEEITINHILKFPEVFEPKKNNSESELEWKIFQEALIKAEREFLKMRQLEGRELTKDLDKRWHNLEKIIFEIENKSISRVPEERIKLQSRVKEIIGSENNFNSQRVETEIALLADKLDITEECVRFRSHLNFFKNVMSNKNNDDSVGRKLTFVVQEIMREANTISSKTNDASIAHQVVNIKEELEKIREQLQNLE
ncbi:MAG: YicC family protein [Bacteroidetes bacterium]|nr:YicC family protein [Bacteroidota bacterium]